MQNKRNHTMVYRNDSGFTLFELLVVIIIIGILAALGLPQFSKNQEHAVGKEAIANLKLISAAERIYLMETSAYYPYTTGTDSTLTTINTNLRLSIPTSAARNWNYSVTDTSAPAFSATATRATGSYVNCTYTIDNTGSGQATATRVGAGGRVWTILTPPGSSDVPTCSGTGC